MSERREWFSVKHNATGQTIVTCSIMQGNLSVKWAIRTASTKLGEGVDQARNWAGRMMDELEAATNNL